MAHDGLMYLLDSCVSLNSTQLSQLKWKQEMKLMHTFSLSSDVKAVKAQDPGPDLVSIMLYLVNLPV